MAARFELQLRAAVQDACVPSALAADVDKTLFFPDGLAFNELGRSRHELSIYVIHFRFSAKWLDKGNMRPSLMKAFQMLCRKQIVAPHCAMGSRSGLQRWGPPLLLRARRH